MCCTMPLCPGFGVELNAGISKSSSSLTSCLGELKMTMSSLVLSNLARELDGPAAAASSWTWDCPMSPSVLSERNDTIHY